MTYPPSNPPTPPNGPTGPWQPYPEQGGPQGYPGADQPYADQAYGAPQQPQYPYGPAYGAPAQPQQPYGMPQQPQQPYGMPYGAQPPYGAPYGAQPPGYGYPMPQPPNRSNRKWLAIAGAVIAAVVLVGGIAIFALSGGSGSGGGRDTAGSSLGSANPGESDAEREVRAFLEEMMSNTSTDLSDALPYFCQADQDLFEAVGGLDAIDIPHSSDSDTSTKISNITVTGNKAVVDIVNRQGVGKLYLRKESGSWKICMSDMPGMPSMP